VIKLQQTIIDLFEKGFNYFKYPIFSNVYFQALLIMIIFIIVAEIVFYILEKIFLKLTLKTKTKADDLIVEQTKYPLFYIVLFYGIKLGLVKLSFLPNYLDKGITVLIMIIFMVALNRVLRILIEFWGKIFSKKTKLHVEEVVLPLFYKITKFVVIVIAILWGLYILEIDLTPYLAAAGLGGLVLGLALQDSLKNIFGGLMLVFDETYRIGDKVKLESGEIGVVHDIGLRSTKLRTYDNELIYVPNSYLVNSKLQNFTRPNAEVRVGVEFGVVYGSDVEKVKKVITKTLEKMNVDKINVVFLEMADYALKFKAFFWVDNWADSYSKKLEATEKIYNALNKAKIGIPFPTYTVEMKKK
jgi:small-conductance mechanosensitive channel